MSAFCQRICLILTVAGAILASENRGLCRDADGTAQSGFTTRLEGALQPVAGDLKKRDATAESNVDNQLPDGIPSARPEEDDLSEASEIGQKAPTATPRPCGQAHVPNACRAAARAAAQFRTDSAAGPVRLQI